MKDAIRYEVKVTAILKRTETRRAEWKEKANGEPGYGYTPTLEEVVEREVEVFRQTFDDLDLKRVVAVVNALL